MKRIRIGNDIPIRWKLSINNGKIPLSSVDIEVRLKDEHRCYSIIESTINDGYIDCIFRGKDQCKLGAYDIVAIINNQRPQMATVDHCGAFLLVPCSCNSNIESFPVILEDDVMLYDGQEIPDTLPAPAISIINVTSSEFPGYTGSTKMAYKVEIIAEDGATVKYKIGDGAEQAYSGPITIKEVAPQKTVMAWCEKNGLVSESTVGEVPAIDKVEKATTWSNLAVSLSYASAAPYGGGTLTPTLSVKQTKTVSYWNAPNAVTNNVNVTTSATKTYSKVSGDGTVAADGKVTYSATTDARSTTVKVDVIVNGQSDSKTATASQSAKPLTAHYGISTAKGTPAPSTVNDITASPEISSGGIVDCSYTVYRIVWVAIPITNSNVNILSENEGGRNMAGEWVKTVVGDYNMYYNTGSIQDKYTITFN